MLVKLWRKKEALYTLGNVNWYRHCEKKKQNKNSIEFFQKAKNRNTI